MIGVKFGINGLILNTFDLTMPETAGGGSLKGAKRGSVEGFSSASARRLRQYLATHVGEGIPFAASLTLPYDLSPSDFRSLFHRFCVRSSLPFVWRVELTKRKRPHLHVVGWSPSGVDGVFAFQVLWWDVVGAYIYRGGEEHSCVVELLRGADWFKYVACHSSKHKGEQLGWVGRQWGVVNRSMMRDASVFVPLSRESSIKVLRVVRLLARCRLLQYGSVGSSVWYLRPSTISSLLSWARTM